MKRFYQDYSPQTAREIVAALPKAYSLYSRAGGKWGPGIIAKAAGFHAATVGRYLKAFREAQLGELIREVTGVQIPAKHGRSI